MVIVKQPIFSITRILREQQKNQKVSCSGLLDYLLRKSTIANELEQLLVRNSNHTFIFDGDTRAA